MTIRQSSWQRPLLLKKLEELLVFSSTVVAFKNPSRKRRRAGFPPGD